MFGAALLLSALAPAARADQVDLLLVLAVDVSRSIDDDEAKLQRDGYIAALTSPQVIGAIKSGAHGAIAVAYFEWASSDYQRLIVPWTIIRDDGDAARVADTINTAPRYAMSWTSISGAIDYGANLIRTGPHRADRMVIDVSGDGRNNNGRPAEAARDEAVRAGIVINGLPVINDRPNFGRPPETDLDTYYENSVVGGVGSFMIVAHDFNAFPTAVLSKLIKEIAAIDPASGKQFAGSDK